MITLTPSSDATTHIQRATDEAHAEFKSTGVKQVVWFSPGEYTLTYQGERSRGRWPIYPCVRWRSGVVYAAHPGTVNVRMKERPDQDWSLDAPTGFFAGARQHHLGMYGINFFGEHRNYIVSRNARPKKTKADRGYWRGGHGVGVYHSNNVTIKDCNFFNSINNLWVEWVLRAHITNVRAGGQCMNGIVLNRVGSSIIDNINILPADDEERGIPNPGYKNPTKIEHLKYNSIGMGFWYIGARCKGGYNENVVINNVLSGGAKQEAFIIEPNSARNISISNVAVRDSMWGMVIRKGLQNSSITNVSAQNCYRAGLLMAAFKGQFAYLRSVEAVANNVISNVVTRNCGTHRNGKDSWASIYVSRNTRDNQFSNLKATCDDEGKWAPPKGDLINIDEESNAWTRCCSNKKSNKLDKG